MEFKDFFSRQWTLLYRSIDPDLPVHVIDLSDQAVTWNGPFINLFTMNSHHGQSSSSISSDNAYQWFLMNSVIIFYIPYSIYFVVLLLDMNDVATQTRKYRHLYTLQTFNHANANITLLWNKLDSSQKYIYQTSNERSSINNLHVH